MRASVVFAGGGTGGHIFPAIAIAQQLTPGIESTFVCSIKQLDARIIAEAGYASVPIPAQPFSIRPAGLIRLARSWGGTVRTARGLLRAQRQIGPVVVVAMGGYVAPPVVQGARVERVSVVLINLDATPGKANRWIARHAQRVVSTVPIAQRAWEVVGPIVRDEARAPGDARACRAMLGLDPDRPTLLVTGASQGARSLNLFMARFAQSQPESLAGWQVLHQAGTVGGIDEARDAYKASGIPAKVSAFLDPMGPAWGAADLALSRAGAGSVAEARVNRVPTIFVPYPGHRDEHQAANARQAVEAGAALVVSDRQDPELNMAGLGGALGTLLGDAPARLRMARAWASLGDADGAAAIARIIDELLSAA